MFDDFKIKNKKILYSLLIFILVLNIIPLSVSASQVKYADVTINNGIIDSVGTVWSTADDDGDSIPDSIDYTGNRANLSTSSISSFTGSFWTKKLATDIRAQKDFHIETNLSFLNFHTGGNEHNIVDLNFFANQFSLYYNPSTKKFNYILYHSDSTSTYGSFPEQFNLVTGKEYKIIFGREGMDVVLSVDEISATSQPILKNIKVSDSVMVFVGMPTAGGYSNISLRNIKILSGLPNPSISENAEFNLTEGVINLETDPLSFGEIAFNYDVAQEISDISNLILTDNRANGFGWDIKVSSSDFTSTFADSSGGNGNITISLPSNSLSVEPLEIITNSGQLVDNLYGPYSSDLILSSLSQSLISSDLGYGMGKYTIPFKYTLTIPKIGLVKDVTGTGSKYSIGDTIGIVQGIYNATITYNIGTGL
jgi:hypothetical protein